MKEYLENNLTIDNVEMENITLTPSVKNQTISLSPFEIKNGYGACKASGCGCNGYKPNDPLNDYCRVCGHHWERHY